MTLTLREPIITRLIGDCRAMLREIESDSIQTLVTSPPYLWLRRYPIPDTVWGGDPDHVHQWGDDVAPYKPHQVVQTIQPVADAVASGQTSPRGRFCRCGAWCGQLGLEPTPTMYVLHLVEIFQEVRRVLHPSGTVWLNIGDSYAGSGRGPTGKTGIGSQQTRQGFTGGIDGPSARDGIGIWGLKRKDRMLIPERVVMALQEDGWYLRQEIVWEKNGLPESVDDRPTTSHEKVWLLTKSADYFYDVDGFRPNDANVRSVWKISGEPLKDAHYAPFPSELPRRGILLGTSAAGMCPTCYAPFERMVASERLLDGQPATLPAMRTTDLETPSSAQGFGHDRVTSLRRTLGWRPTCPHYTICHGCQSCDFRRDHWIEGPDPVPQRALDIFGGSGTTALAAKYLGRDCVLIEANGDQYQEIQDRRLTTDVPRFARETASPAEPASYDTFLASKQIVVQPTGFEVDRDAVRSALFDYQRDLVRWAVRKGRSALFATTGLGKTLMQLEWADLVARETGRPVLILAPLSVAHQTVEQGATFGIEVSYARNQAEARSTGLTITNYEMLHQFDPSAFVGVVLDESGILKDFEGATRTTLIRTFRATPFKLCCSATPAPNDHAELGNHAEFLGVMKREEMLASFFVHDEDGWRLKGHAQDAFYAWLASWAMSLKAPSDLGYSDEGFVLPELTIDPVIVPFEVGDDAGSGIVGRAALRRETVEVRVQATLERITPDEQWLIWCGTNAEQEAVEAALGDQCVSIHGKTPLAEKIRLEKLWRSGAVRHLVTKPKVMGWGMNWQHCARMAFVGLSDSYEAYFQCIRRCYRFGQTRPVQVLIVLSEPERVIYENVLRKEQDAEMMVTELVKHVAAFERAEIAQVSAHDDTPHEQPMRLPAWLMEAS